MATNDFNKRFDAYYHARRDLHLYQHIEVDESENLSPGIHASVIRYQPTHPDLDEEEDANTENNDEEWQFTDWEDPDEEF